MREAAPCCTAAWISGQERWGGGGIVHTLWHPPVPAGHSWNWLRTCSSALQFDQRTWMELSLSLHEWGKPKRGCSLVPVTLVSQSADSSVVLLPVVPHIEAVYLANSCLSEGRALNVSSVLGSGGAQCPPPALSRTCLWIAQFNGVDCTVCVNR